MQGAFTQAVSLEVRDLRHVYQSASGSVEVLHGVSFQLNAGRLLAVLGPSGSGKSTLLHLVAGLETPTSGDVLWGGAGLRGLSQDALVRRRALEVGLVFQHHYLLEDLTTLENVALPGLIADRPDDARSRALLRRVGLEARAGFYPRTLSGGERQRVALARALLTRPRLVLADEPTGSLDRQNAQLVFALIRELAREESTAVVVVTHDQELAQQADEIIRLRDGRLAG
jgi:lipoprotein-releasing system ATP-binding protein